MPVLDRILSKRPTELFIGACEPCRRPVRGSFPEASGDVLGIPCPECGVKTRTSRIYATTVDTSCDAACMGAVGPACSCSCEGVNHGGSWAPATHQSTISADALAKYRERIEKQERERNRKAEAERKRRRAAFDEWAEDHGDVIEFLKSTDVNNDFIDDMLRRVERLDELTDRQSAGVRKFIENARRRAAEDERRKGEEENAGPVPEGRLTISGEVVMAKIYDNHFSYSGSDYRMMVRLDNGAKVFGTIPRALQTRPTEEGNLFALRGVRVQFDATVTAKDGEPTFGYYKRPTKAKFI
ncbi:hypothetical protein OG756_41565 (plasmid) [Streptomyces sp. NBC_01310]|uniref:hypothetical protein n=1 Tax=Streptomyces sp. NBC_01310 TaxID=2903820 RepID=UPI0035B5F0FA|nr:hypothetical protein OG756_41565 [Streptomyces sp. NBC_01310]